MITQNESEDDFHVTLIDFGLATKYIRKKQHISDNEQVDYFRGVIHLADLDKLNFFATSRRDDIQSLFHMFVQMLNDDKLYGDKSIVKKLILT